MVRKVEIEERALLNKDERIRVLDYMKQLGHVEEVRSVTVHYMTDGEAAELRIDNGTLSLVRLYVNSRRRVVEETQELSESLLIALRNMASDGYSNAKISLRHRHEVTDRNLIYSLRDILHYKNPRSTDNICLFELEQDIFDGHDERSRVRIHQAMRQLGIRPVKSEEFDDWMDATYDNIDGNFEYSEGSALALVMKLERLGFIA